MSAPNRSRSGSRGIVAAAVLGASLLAAGLVGCGGGNSDERNIVLPPGGVAVGNIVCTGTPEPWTNVVQHGQTITIRFTLTDVNVQLVGANLPIAFDVVGGTLLDPPTHTDANGVAVVHFYASDRDFVGAGRVRLIQPDARLDCDVSFTVYPTTVIIRAIVTDGNGNIITPLDACGSFEPDVERHETRRVRFIVTRLDPFNGNVEIPVIGARLRLRAVGLLWDEIISGPTDANGRVEQLLTPFRDGEIRATITRELLLVDLDGPLGGPDGVPDELPSNPCSVSFGIINDICTDNGATITPVYSSGLGSIRPGESATLTASYVVNGVPQADRWVLVDAVAGLINGSQVPYRARTNGAGLVTVTYTAPDGFSGNDTVTFVDEAGTLRCTQTATVAVKTCDIQVVFGAPVTSGADVPLTIHVLNVDPATAIGEIVALDVVGGFFTEQPPYYELVDHMGKPTVMTTLHVTPGFSGAASLALSFVSGYGCTTVSKPFTVNP